MVHHQYQQYHASGYKLAAPTARSILFFLLAAWVVYITLFASSPTDIAADKQLLEAKPQTRDVVVMYIFSATDPQYITNLQFFLNEAVAGDTLCDYVIVVQGQAPDSGLPSLPDHAQYIHHSNTCYDWGTFGWLIKEGHVDTARYKYFLFINSSVRGPFMPAYARGKVHWTAPFIHRLSDSVKLVGPTISCEGTPLEGNTLSTWRRNPHVQSYAVATDQVGLGILKADPHVFFCHTGRWNTIYYSELGASAAMLAAGYNIDCFMTRYQGVDWRDPAMWDCNKKFSTQGEYYYDGITLDPLEVMFVKIKGYSLQNDLSSARSAAKYHDWLQREDNNWTAITSNEYLAEPAKFKLPKILEQKARGPSCFDFDYYLAANQDLRGVLTTEAAQWKHFVYMGQFELRPHRFTCEVEYEKLTIFEDS